MTEKEKNKKGSVLIVEDDKLISLVQERLLKKLGFEVKGKAKSGSEAIEKVKSSSPDLILMDISLAGDMDGIETMTEIRKFSDTPVIYLSGDQDKYNYRRAKSTGFIDYLVKPVTADELVGPVSRAVKESRKQKQGSNPQSYSRAAG